jgi:iron complex outermembrane receptor protein
MRIDYSFRRSMMIASALTGVLMAPELAAAQSSEPAGGSAGSSASRPSTATEPANISTGSASAAPVVLTAGGGQQPVEVEKIRAEYKRLLLREKNSPSAVTELGSDQIAQVGVQGSPSTLLRQAPSVNVYQQGIGNNEPVLSIRGIRGLETAQTLDGVPMQDLLQGGSGGYLSNLLGGKFDLSQISGVSIYPGVAFPSENTFGTIGGTVAYDSLRPSADRGVDVLGSVGSFGTFQEGFTLNSGKMDGALGTGYNAPSMMLQYTNLQTKGFIDYTPARYNNMEFAFDKPYDSGLSKFSATVLYNTGSGLYLDEPTPLPYLQQNGRYSNPSPAEQFAYQYSNYATMILNDRTYINPYVTVGGDLFYENTNSFNETYGNPSIFYASPQHPGSITVGGAPPFNQTSAGFGEAGAFGRGGPFYDPAVGVTYDGNKMFPVGSSFCPASVSNAFTSTGQASPCGYNANANNSQTDTYGIQPRITLTPPSIYGTDNTIKIGALIAKETSPFSPNYNYGTTPVPQTPANQVGGVYSGELDGGTQRVIYQVYAQDKVDMFANTLHITPGATFEYSASSFVSSSRYGGTPTPSQAANPYCAAGNTCNFGAYQGILDERQVLPFLNVDYGLDKIFPRLKGVSLYGSYGESALFAPVSDFSPNTEGFLPPSAAIVHMYEGGVRYYVSNLVLSADYYYQKVDRDFGNFTYQSGPLNGQSAYNNLGSRQFQGQEASIQWQVTPQWQLFGNASHVRAVYLATDVGFVTIQNDQFGDVIRGTPITGVPNWLSTFGVQYDHKNWFRQGDEFQVRFEGQYTGKQSTSYDVTGFTNLGPLPTVPAYPSRAYYDFTSGATTYDPNGGLAAYVLFNLDMNYKLPIAQTTHGIVKSLDFDLNILNLFNNGYFQYFYKQISPTNPITFTSGPFKGQQSSNYNGASFSDALAGEPFAATFTITAKF